MRAVARCVSEEERCFLADTAGDGEPLLALGAMFRSRPTAAEFVACRTGPAGRRVNAIYFVAARREPSGITVGKPGGLRRSANKKRPQWSQSRWHWALAAGFEPPAA